MTTDDPQRLQALATRFEEQVYKQASNMVCQFRLVLIREAGLFSFDSK